MSDYLLPVFFGLVLVLFVRRSLAARQTRPLPPGPPKLPLLGNLLQMPSTRVGQVYDEWCRHYSMFLVPSHYWLVYLVQRVGYRSHNSTRPVNSNPR